MAYCFDELGDYAVTPMLVSPCDPEKCCQPPPCYPCLPRCPKGQVVYYCEKPQSTQSKSSKNCDNCCYETPKAESHCKRRSSSPPRDDCCPTCSNPCKPIKTKYVIPCYRYEDGRIEQYVPTRHGRLPITAYRRNGMQDQIHGYRGAQRYLCAGSIGSEYHVYTAVEPIRRIYPKVTQEMLPVNPLPSSALKRNGLQDQQFLESSGISYIRKCWRNATWSDSPFILPVKPMKKLPSIVRKLPVSAFKRNGIQDQEHSKLLGTANFLKRCPRDVAIECEVSPVPLKVKDPVKVPEYNNPIECCLLKKEPIEVSLEDVLYD
ncbi:uncharacterized protein LOC123871130 [Maniola jurtina]|uniref:uncharacterized protein LOC123871130 n=1 Tax=Maniola jurtina TaxID=191418 RepID=UPI001E68A350|nr:uncharacterized protein LOC123871130 [Maniola jurtina]